eukprot:3099562-Prymnesium_polylepis.1
MPTLPWPHAATNWLSQSSGAQPHANAPTSTRPNRHAFLSQLAMAGYSLAICTNYNAFASRVGEPIAESSQSEPPHVCTAR